MNLVFLALAFSFIVFILPSIYFIYALSKSEKLQDKFIVFFLLVICSGGIFITARHLEMGLTAVIIGIIGIFVFKDNILKNK